MAAPVCRNARPVLQSWSALSTRFRGFSSRPARTPERTAESADGAGGGGLKAEDLAEKIRKEKRDAEVEKKQQQQVPTSPLQERVQELKKLSGQLQQVHPNVLAKVLKQGLLFENENIIVANKPYGVPMDGGPNVKNNIADILPTLAKMLGGMRAEPLHICHRLDKETTGAFVLAKSEGAAEWIRKVLKTHQLERKYWALSVGVPVPSEGVIDIPIVEKEIAGPQPHFKMALSPLYRLNEGADKVTRVRPAQGAQSAVTRYGILSSTGNSALLEVQPVTGVKHQIRVHMAYGLGCQILGDHKYAHWNKLAPQKLPERMLQKLGLEQAKVRHLPLHLHLRQLILPGVEGQEEIRVICPLPKFFFGSLKKLKIKLPDKDQK
uniref:Pseudouridylate synthase RPUSD4, mitochondrial n=1 Tax=Erpetoichthys calabaricus TaxID=27687 RepID=A0A8C4X941_ERPCA